MAMLFGAAGVAAQNPYIAPEGATDEGAIVITQPRTVLTVDVTATCEKTQAGPYARYAQKYLDVRAPLTDKCVWTVTGAAVALADAAAQVVPDPAPAACVVADEPGAELPIDKVGLDVLPLEDAARAAAAKIFQLRKQRMDLISGEVGEHVFGAGLETALAEIARLERAYAELFLGRRIVTTESRRYTVYPVAGRKQYVVGRFAPDAGLLPAGDLTGDMVVLQIEPSGDRTDEPESKAANVVRCREADLSACSVVCGGRELVRATLPIFEFGRTVNVVVNRRR